MITLENIRKTYLVGNEQVHALDGVSLSIKESEFVAIIGSSGSGKSTLMNIIGCLDNAEEGSYFIDGQDTMKMSEKELGKIRNQKIGFIFQQFNLIPKLNAYENVELPLIYQGVGGKERGQRVKECLEKVGLKERMYHRPNQLSGGQQQRVAVARALVTRPTLILADEPTGNLDSKSSHDIITLIHELHQQGNTIVLITHDNEIAKEACRQVKLFDGKIIWDSQQESKDSREAEK
ncbi:MAG: ABC transporter ATP-binding protein [Lachnospiraceae bacterium]